MTSLEEIKRLLAAATPGPMVSEWDDFAETLVITCEARTGKVPVAEIQCGFVDSFDAEQKANAKLIVAAVNEIGGIIEQMERLQKVADAASLVCDDAVADGVHPESFCEVGTPELDALRQALEESK